jgi:quercetin dioxygenase-like cupin family protein
MKLPDGYYKKDVEVIEHHFIGGTYFKKMSLSAGDIAITHAHNFDHGSILIKGMAIVTCDGIERVYEPGDVIEIKSGVKHSIKALDDVIWLCVHAIPEDLQDLNIDEVLIKRAELS